MICSHAKSDMTPCVLRDGSVAWAINSNDKPICVGCEKTPKVLGMIYPKGWSKIVAEYKRGVRR